MNEDAIKTRPNGAYLDFVSTDRLVAELINRSDTCVVAMYKHGFKIPITVHVGTGENIEAAALSNLMLLTKAESILQMKLLDILSDQ